MIDTGDEYLEAEIIQCDTTLWTPPFKCAVASCKNVFTKFDSKSIIKYHDFPTNSELQQLWLESCCLHLDFHINLAKVCTVHFLPSDYETVNKGNGKRKVLKSNVVPTQFLQQITEIDFPSEVNVQSFIDENILLKQTHTKMVKEHEMLVNKLTSLEKQHNLKNRKFKLLKKRYKQFKEYDNSNEEKNLLRQVFSPSQINVLLNKKRVTWSNEDMAMAFTLRQMGNRDSYLYLKKTLNFPLPSLSSVQKWAAST